MGNRSSDDRPLARLATVLSAALLAVAVGALGMRSTRAAEGGDRLRSMQEEIVRLRAELEALGRREEGLLGEVARLGAVLKLRDREAEEASVRLEQVRSGLENRKSRISELQAAQAGRERILVARLREVYKRGTDIELRRALGGGTVEAYLQGVRYASFLSEREARLLRGWRQDQLRLTAEAEALAGEERKLEQVRLEAVRAAEELERSRAGRSKLLESIRMDREKHQEAIEDLERASRELGRLVDTLGGVAREPALDVRKFRGLLDWPAAGRVSAAYGDAIHPRFRTVVPHPGLDIDAPEGESFGAVFDGRVVFSSWLHGYGLTVIVDHGGGVVSIYAHASILLAAAGDQVARGQVLGKVGDTGSLRGAYLYFEMREDGRSTDPGQWLRRR